MALSRGLTLLVALGATLAMPRLAVGARPDDPRVNVPLCTAADNQFVPSAVADGGGGVVVAWTDHRSGVDYDVFAQHLLASGDVDPAWPVNGSPVCVAAGDQLFPVGVPDGSGGVVLAWIDRRGTDYDLYAQHVLADGSTDAAWPVNGVALTLAVGDQLGPSIVSDGLGGAIVTWYDLRHGLDYDIYAQHVTSGGVVDPAWPVDGLAVCTAPGYQLFPVAVRDGAGGAIVAWYDPRTGAGYDIYAQHVLPAGVVDPAWPVDGLPVCTAPGDQVAPQITTDGAGGAIVAWADGRSGVDDDVYAQHVQASGAVDPAWIPGGVVVTAAVGDQLAPAILPDGSGGAIVAWTDARAGNDDVYLQRVRSDGRIADGWPDDGRAACAAAGDQRFPLLVTDGAGGAVVAWMDHRGNDDDVYAAHVGAAGVMDPAWPIDGRALCLASGDQAYPTPVPDGEGGALVAWQDGRGPIDVDIYAQRVFASGQLSLDVVAAPAPPPVALALEPPRPNPSRGGTLRVEFSLADGGDAVVEWLDLAGRRLESRDVSSLGPGRHDIVLGVGRRTPPGVYFIRVRQGEVVRSARVVVVP